MPKKLENMTVDERLAHFDKTRATKRKERDENISSLNTEQKLAVIKLHNRLDEVLDIALYPDMGGIRCVSAYDLQELHDVKNELAFQFNLKE